jgi:hypothetical protein
MPVFMNGCTSPLLRASSSFQTQVLQVPVLKPKAAKKLLQGIGPRVPILGSSNVPWTEDTLQQFLQHTGTLFGRDPTKWEKVGEYAAQLHAAVRDACAPAAAAHQTPVGYAPGETKTDITEQDGKRIIRRTGMFTGTELHLWEVLPYFDPRLPPRQDQPNLDFSVQRKEIASNAEWQQVGHESCKPGRFKQRHCLLSVTAIVGEH